MIDFHGEQYVIINSDARHSGLPDGSVHCAITSPPYYRLRAYGTEPKVWGGDQACSHAWVEGTNPEKSGGTASDKLKIKGTENFQIVPATEYATCTICGAWKGELGQEPTPDLFIEHLCDVFDEVKRVLRDDGCCWVNLGSSYAASRGSQGRGHGNGVLNGESVNGNGNDVLALRDDLSADEVAFVLAELSSYAAGGRKVSKPDASVGVDQTVALPADGKQI